jgi:hypothetical protein
VEGELAPGVYGGEKGLEAAYLSFHGVDSIEEIGRDLQLNLLEDDDDRDLPAERRAA